MKITHTDTLLPYAPDAIDFLVDALDGGKGMYMASGTEYPGRYSRWDTGFDLPPVEVLGFEGRTEFRALNARGEKMLDIFRAIFARHPDAAFTVDSPSPATRERVGVRDYPDLSANATAPSGQSLTPPREGRGSLPLPQDGRGQALVCRIAPRAQNFAEEDRSRQPSPLSPLRRLMRHVGKTDAFAGFYGPFKYDLLFCFNPIPLKHARGADHALFHLYIPDSLHLVDRRKETAFRRDYEFSFEGETTAALPRPERKKQPPAPPRPPGEISSDMTDAAYADLVRRGIAHMKKGDIFEIVFSRRFSAPYAGAPSTLFRNVRRVNPSPYEFLIQLGDEQLVGASPEMFVRVEGRRVETCPIAGTARRSKAGGQAAVIEDARILQGLLNSKKDAAELTMCTDVDRNDKARVCVPGSVRLIGHRQIETYAGLFHTVDHIEGALRDDCDGIDAFLSHMWAVTLTGAPKPEAAKIIEDVEPAPRDFYGAALGALHFSGDVNTGITIRTLHLKDGIASQRVGASLVLDSIPEDEAAETHTKSTFFRRILSGAPAAPAVRAAERTGAGKTVILIDNEDSFVQTLADYIRQTGARAMTYRHGTDLAALLAEKPHLVVHSPGPGMPSQFRVPETVRLLAETGVPQFGVCLGLQGIFEAFGGTLGFLQNPQHGKTWTITHTGHKLFENVPSPCTVGAYHSIHGIKETLPTDLEVTAVNENGVIMALAHKKLPVWAVQFHPESVMSLQDDAGIKMIENVMRSLAS